MYNKIKNGQIKLERRNQSLLAPSATWKIELNNTTRIRLEYNLIFYSLFLLFVRASIKPLRREGLRHSYLKSETKHHLPLSIITVKHGGLEFRISK